MAWKRRGHRYRRRSRNSKSQHHDVSPPVDSQAVQPSTSSPMKPKEDSALQEALAGFKIEESDSDGQGAGSSIASVDENSASQSHSKSPKTPSVDPCRDSEDANVKPVAKDPKAPSRREDLKLGEPTAKSVLHFRATVIAHTAEIKVKLAECVLESVAGKLKERSALLQAARDLKSSSRPTNPLESALLSNNEQTLIAQIEGLKLDQADIICDLQQYQMELKESKEKVRAIEETNIWDIFGEEAFKYRFESIKKNAEKHERECAQSTNKA